MELGPKAIPYMASEPLFHLGTTIGPSGSLQLFLACSLDRPPRRRRMPARSEARTGKGLLQLSTPKKAFASQRSVLLILIVPRLLVPGTQKTT